jgi:hypothetical protein
VARDLLDDSLPGEWVQQHDDYISGLTNKERAKEMMLQVERTIDEWKKQEHGNPFWLKTVEEGQWRKKGLADDAMGLAQKIVDSTDTDPRSCHFTTARAFQTMEDEDRIQYCEGLAFPKHLGRTVRHAWLEIEGHVAEITWPWHRVNGDDAMYYGLSVPQNKVEKRLDDRGIGSELMLTDEEYLTAVRQRNLGT